MFAYCTEVLHLSEAAAYARIEVARAVRRLPQLLDRLADGSLSLTAIRRLASVLTPDNCDRLVLEARHRTAREMDLLIARERPRPDAPALIRRLPSQTELVSRRVADPSAGEVAEDVAEDVEEEIAEQVTSAAPSVRLGAAARPRSSIQPLTPERHRVQFTASSEMRERIERLQNLLRHRIPDGDLAAVIDTALIELLTTLEKQKFGAVAERGTPRRRREMRRTPAAQVAESGRERERAPSRSIPCAVRHAVWRRDRERCGFVAVDGKRCSATAFLEFHHVEPFARGGGTTDTNLQLRCRAHNAYEAECEGLGRRDTASATLRSP